MKLLFIVPAIGKKAGEPYIGTWKMEPLTIATLKALTPKEHDVTLFDDRIELIDYRYEADAVFIPVETYTARRSYEIAAVFRRLGRKVILGGYHVTLVPEEAGGHADSLILGNAEGVWRTVLRDLEQGIIQPIYHGSPQFSQLLPDLSAYAGKKYLPVSLVETGRGCIHRCEFCAISSYYDHCYYKRPVEDILRDVRQARHKYFFLVDDNLLADREHALALFEALRKEKIKWAGQGTLHVGKDPELLRLMKRSGCEILLIGFESLREKNLRQMHKSINLQKDRDQLVEAIHAAGINIYATFVFGYDEDDAQSVQEALQFSRKHRFFTAAFNHLLPFPGTDLYERLRQSGRLFHETWWLQKDYHYGSLSFQPASISAQDLAQACFEARRAFNTPRELLRRGASARSRSSLMTWMLFWLMNVPIGREVSQKMNVPIGENLDELPK